MGLSSPGDFSRRPQRGHRPLAEINVTPLVDVMLVLLIIFMITAPMLAAGLKVNLPKAQAARPLEARPPVVLTLTADGTLQLDQDRLTLAELVPALVARLGDPGAAAAIHVRGDREVAYGEVVRVMDELARAGFTRLALVATSRPAAAPGAPGPGGGAEVRP